MALLDRRPYRAHLPLLYIRCDTSKTKSTTTRREHKATLGDGTARITKTTQTLANEQTQQTNRQNRKHSQPTRFVHTHLNTATKQLPSCSVVLSAPARILSCKHTTSSGRSDPRPTLSIQRLYTLIYASTADMLPRRFILPKPLLLLAPFTPYPDLNKNTRLQHLVSRTPKVPKASASTRERETTESKRGTAVHRLKHTIQGQDKAATA